MFIFGSMTLLSAAANNFGGLFALRFFLGMAESGFFPLVIYYLTTFYRRGELARRLAIFYAASNIANAFVRFVALLLSKPICANRSRAVFYPLVCSRSSPTSSSGGTFSS